jgi:tetratricopeptide (TPR) repeat protein
MKSIELSTAASHIKQACEDTRSSTRSPFFFLVGAGISHPSVPLAADIETQCRGVAAKYERLDEPLGTKPIDTYSHWMGTAFPQPVQRQRYLRGLIERKPISHANLRLAHLLLGKTLTNLVVTTNFDDLLSRALTLFGEPHIICDHPSTVERIDPEQNDLQLVHVHGSYWFYDCCNLHGELQARASVSSSTSLTMGSLLDNILSHRSPIVIGYSGWEGDVLMSALRRRLNTRLPFNLYWFCHHKGALEYLPDWLRAHEDAFFVLPSPKKQSEQQQGVAKAKEQPIEVIDSAAPVQFTSAGDKESGELALTAQQVLDELIQSFQLPAPDLTLDPLGFFAKQLRGALPHGTAPQPQSDLYFIDSVIMRIERATLREQETSQLVESHLESVRDALRRSQYREGILNAQNLRMQDLSEVQLREVLDAVRAAAVGLDDHSAEELRAHELAIGAIDTLRRLGRYDSALEEKLLQALMSRGLTLKFMNSHEQALEAFQEVLKRFALRPEAVIQESVAESMFSQAEELGNLGRFGESFAAYDEVIRKFGAATEKSLQETVAEAFLGKADMQDLSDDSNEALTTYDQLLARFGDRTDGRMPTLVVRALVRKAMVLESSDKVDEALAIYQDVIDRFRDSADPSVKTVWGDALRRKGQRLLFLNRREEALQNFQEALAADPKNRVASLGLVGALRALGQFEKALATARALLPDYPAAYSAASDALADLGKYSAARELLNQVIKARPKYAQPYLSLGDLLRELGEFEHSTEIYQRALKLFPNNVVLLQGYAIVLSAAGNNSEALALLTSALQRHTASASSILSVMGRVHRHLRNFEKATACFEEAIKQNNKAAHGSLGYLQLANGDLAKAKPNLRTAVSSSPSSPFARINLGILYQSVGDLERAAAVFSEALSIVASSLRPSRAILRVTALLGLQKLEEAEALFSVLRDNIPQLERVAGDLWDDLAIMSRNPKLTDIAERFRQAAGKQTVRTP